MASPAAWVHVTGTETVQFPEAPTESAGALHLRSTTVDTMSDPRVSGTGTVIETITGDISAGIGLDQATYSLKNAGGTWDGTCAGAEWDSGNGMQIYCWLVGGGGYAGLTYYVNLSEPTAGSLALDGIIYPGSPPAH